MAAGDAPQTLREYLEVKKKRLEEDLKYHEAKSESEGQLDGITSDTWSFNETLGDDMRKPFNSAVMDNLGYQPSNGLGNLTQSFTNLGSLMGGLLLNDPEGIFQLIDIGKKSFVNSINGFVKELDSVTSLAEESRTYYNQISPETVRAAKDASNLSSASSHLGSADFNLASLESIAARTGQLAIFHSGQAKDKIRNAQNSLLGSSSGFKLIDLSNLRDQLKSRAAVLQRRLDSLLEKFNKLKNLNVEIGNISIRGQFGGGIISNIRRSMKRVKSEIDSRRSNPMMMINSRGSDWIVRMESAIASLAQLESVMDHTSTTRYPRFRDGINYIGTGQINPMTLSRDINLLTNQIDRLLTGEVINPIDALVDRIKTESSEIISQVEDVKMKVKETIEIIKDPFNYLMNKINELGFDRWGDQLFGFDVGGFFNMSFGKSSYAGNALSEYLKKETVPLESVDVENVRQALNMAKKELKIKETYSFSDACMDNEKYKELKERYLEIVEEVFGSAIEAAQRIEQRNQ